MSQQHISLKSNRFFQINFLFITISFLLPKVCAFVRSSVVYYGSVQQKQDYESFLMMKQSKEVDDRLQMYNNNRWSVGKNNWNNDDDRFRITPPSSKKDWKQIAALIVDTFDTPPSYNNKNDNNWIGESFLKDVAWNMFERGLTEQ